ncbi:MAG: hypothetical protein KC618_06420, partial [Candidatus Omnitrophica bacterium]|nr:hypothetical protein [Candidatus Omnitrophota bacterium]
MIAIGYFLSFLLGRLTLDRCLKENVRLLHPCAAALLALVSGLGLSALLTFLTFVALDSFHRPVIILINISAVIIFLFFNRNLYIHKTIMPLTDWLPWSKFRWFHFLYILLGVFILGVTYVIALTHPYGEWDAWAIWNLKTRFLITSDSWNIIFTDLHYHTHPDYPLLLPFFNTWIYCFSAENLHPIPMITNIIFVTGCGGFLCCILYQIKKFSFPFLMGLIMLTTPSYLYLGTFQYADSLIAFFLLINLYLITMFQNTKEASWLNMLGLSLGLTAFIKNEGLLMALILMFLVSVYILLGKGNPVRKAAAKHLLLTFFITFVPVLIFKVFIAPPNDDILPNINASNFTAERFQILYNAVITEIFHEKWCYMWIIILALLISRIWRAFNRENTILSVFFIIYSSAIVCIYVLNGKADLFWWLETSLSRILFSILPALVFFGIPLH